MSSTLVKCINCGSGFDAGFWVTMTALLVAAAALGIAFREHRVFMRELSARARFRLIPSVVGAGDDHTIRTDADSVQVRVVFGLKNEGEKASTTTILNALVPARIRGFRWCGLDGEDLPDAPQPGQTVEDLDGDGHAEPALWLPLEVPRVAKRPYLARQFAFMVDVPREGSAMVPVRMKAQADELPDDVDEVTADLLVTVVRG